MSPKGFEYSLYSGRIVIGRIVTWSYSDLQNLKVELYQSQHFKKIFYYTRSQTLPTKHVGL